MRLCVAINQTGDVLASMNPAAGVRDWTKTTVDPDQAITGLACPSTRLCVAVDNAGDLVTSTDPGDRRWSVANLEGANAFIGVACPSTSVCVAATASDLLVSKNPAAGASSWTITPNADTATGPECGKYGDDSGCAVTMVLLSCGSSTYCSAVDDYGGSVSGDPLTGTWTSRDGAGIETEALACLPTSTCLSLCAVAAGLGGDDCTGTDYYATDLCDDGDCFQISPQSGDGLWCQSVAMCFAAVGNDLIASTNPPSGTWATVYLGPKTKSDRAVTGLSCPTGSSCVAVNAFGQLLLGAQLPTPRQIGSMLAKQLAPGDAQTRVTTLLKRDGCSSTLFSPTAGRLTITWKAAGHTRSDPVIARGAGTFRSSGTIKIKILLTAAGKRLIRAAQTIRITATAKLSRAGAGVITESRTFQLSK
jgi:hypothetical protein